MIATTSNADEARKLQKVLPALRLVESPAGPRRLAKLLLTLLILSIAAMLFAPWQQSVRGTGRVVAYAPLERQQVIEATISGQIARWNRDVVEGTRLKKGDFILEIRDNDPNLLSRLEKQRSAAEQELAAAKVRAEAYRSNVSSYKDAKEQVIEAVTNQVKMSEQKVKAAKQGLAAANAAHSQSLANEERQRLLYVDGIASQLVFEVAERTLKEAESKVKEAEANVESAERELESKEAEALQKELEAQAKVDTAKADLQDAVGKIAKATKDLTDVEVKLARQQSQVVTAPRDGTVFRFLANVGGEMVSAGDPLLTLVPESAERAVEIWLTGNDAPLVTPGRHVRLQFEGWPAVQFAGWPSVAVGTFGGTVATLDATDNGRGQFRILVVPEEGADWPSDRYLRQGVRANGWVLLSQVQLGFELWRQLNGFPPVIAPDEPKEGDGSKSVATPKRRK